MRLQINPESIRGFLHHAEGEALYQLGREAGRLGPCLEIGSYCGKSAVYIGSGVRASGGQLFSVDHHRGSEEHQPGELFHEPGLLDNASSRVNTLPEFMATLEKANLEDTVIPIVATSERLGRLWRTPLAMVFIDGGHSAQAANTDLNAWMPHIVPGGFLAIHDIFESEAEGGQAPRAIYEQALASGLFSQHRRIMTLGILRRQPL